MSIVPDKLYHMGGVAVGSSRDFEGWWGGETFFVDYDNGSTGVRGDEMDRPQKHLRIAINNAGADDTIYIRPRAFATGTYGEDPQQITPDTAASFVITSKKNLSIIGTGKGLGTAGVHKCWIGNYGSLTTPVLTINSPGCVIEGLRAQPGSSTGGVIFSSSNSGTATVDGGNTTIINNEFHDGGTGGAIALEATWQMTITNNRFMNCDRGLYMTASYSEPTFIEVSHNQFVAITTELAADVSSSGGIKRFRAFNNHHCSGQPAISPGKYYNFPTASTGMISNCFFGVDSTTEADLMTLNGVLQSGNFSNLGQIS